MNLEKDLELLYQKLNEIPRSEAENFVAEVTKKTKLLDQDYLLKSYQNLKLDVIPDPFSEEVTKTIVGAVKDMSPFSAIRIGDGEANILAFQSASYQKTPTLNQKSFEKIVSMQRDCYETNDLWNAKVKELMTLSLLQADILGVLGLWRAININHDALLDKYVENFFSDFRGGSGNWRGIEIMIDFAQENLLKNKLITSAHFYFSVLEHLEELIHSAKEIYIISSRPNLIKTFKEKYPSIAFHFISVGNSQNSKNVQPLFLSDFYSSLPNNMKGTLSLVGAGPWAKIYCNWIKQKGGVSVDIGSGMDLLSGELTRPIHKKFKIKNPLKYKL